MTDAFLSSISPRDFDFAMAAAQVEPIGEDRQDKRLAWLCACIMRSVSVKDFELSEVATYLEQEFRKWASGDTDADLNLKTADFSQVQAMFGG